MVKNNIIKKKLKSRLSENINEEKVCTWIIIPYLTEILNWDMTDIHPEYYVNDARNDRVDYAVGSEKEPEFIVEAKSLGKNLDKYEDQLSSYLDLSDVNYGIITDGLEYRVMERKESANNEKIGIYNLTDEPMDEFRCKSDMETENKSVIDFTNDIKSNIPTDINEKIINPLIVQYGSSKTNIDPIHLYISIDYPISEHFCSFILNSYDELIYIKRYNNKDEEIIKNSKDPSIFIYDNTSSKNSINDNTIKNSVDSIEINKSTDLPNNIPLLVINTPKENEINDFNPILEQITIGDFIRRFDLAYTLKNTKQKFKEMISSPSDLDFIHKLDNKISPTKNNKSITNITISKSIKNEIISHISDCNDKIFVNSLTTGEIQTLEDISKIIAYLDFEDKVDKKHEELAEKILVDSLSDYFEYAEKAEKFNVVVAGSNQFTSQRQRREKILEAINENMEHGDEGAPEELVIDIMVENNGCKQDKIESDLIILQREGKLYEPVTGEYDTI